MFSPLFAFLRSLFARKPGPLVECSECHRMKRDMMGRYPSVRSDCYMRQW